MTGHSSRSPAVQNKYINADKCQNHMMGSKYSQARNTTQGANVTGYVSVLFFSCHSIHIPGGIWKYALDKDQSHKAYTEKSTSPRRSIYNITRFLIHEVWSNCLIIEVYYFYGS